jgi:hypothetical protein
MHLATPAPVSDAAATSTRSLLVLSPVRTTIVTQTNLEVEVSHEGAEAVADAEEDQKTQDEVEEQDSNERIYKQEEEEQEELHPEEDSATTATGTVVSMALGEKMNSMTNTTPPASTTSTGNLTRKTI